MKKNFFKLVLIFIFMGIILFFGFSQKYKNVELLGAGATFPMPLYQKMFEEFYKLTGVKVNYQGIGSGGGIKQLLQQTVDFGATDAYLTEEEHKSAKAEIIHIPTCIGAVDVVYNLPDNPQLNLTPDVIVDIFLGKITKWNDKRIQDINKNVKLPNLDITVVSRSDGSGTTFVFTEYLTKVSKEWETKVGVGKSVSWPVGLSGKGNPGVAGLISQVSGSIGYVEHIYAKQNNMTFANIRNKSGNFVSPSLESTTLAAQTKIPADTKVSLTNTDAPNGYPIASFTWLIVYKEQDYEKRDKNKIDALVDLLWWIVTDGQVFTSQLEYAPLSKEAQDKAKAIVKSITYKKKPVKK